MTTFLVPSFDKNIPDKVNDNIEVISEHELVHDLLYGPMAAIATHGFPSNRDGKYVFATSIDKMVGNACINIGFTSTATHDSTEWGCPGDHGMNGISLFLAEGTIWGGNGVDDRNWNQPHIDKNITRKATEIVSLLTISSNGTNKSVQFMVDGREGPVHECTNRNFEKGGNEIFPVITFSDKYQKLAFIPFDKVKSRSPKIEELMKEFNNKNKPVISAVPSTSTAENDVLISQLRDRITRSQDALIQEKDGVIRSLHSQLTAKDQFLHQQLSAKDQQISMKDEQLELERAEHQKTRNLLHQIKMELKDVELYYLRLNQQKESGQRRQREEEEFKVKQEPGLEEEKEKEKAKPKRKATKKK